MKTEHISYFPYLYEKITSYFSIKVLVGCVWSTFVYLFGHGQSEAILALFLLILVDWVFGIAAAKKTGETITSAKFIRTPVKLAVYFALIASSHISEYALPVHFFLDETMTAGLVITELLSIFEKAGKMGYAIPRRLLNQLEHLRDDNPSLQTKK